MKTYTFEEQKQVAKDIFSRYPKAQKVAVTSDGTAFITDEGDSSVKNHAVNNAYKKELKITLFTREELEDSKGQRPSKAEDLIALIQAATTAEEVEAIRTEEAAGKNRKTVIDAATEKLHSLNNK